MFAQLNPAASTQTKMLAGSLALHALLFAWLLHSPEPQLLTASSIAIGHNGKVATRLYFPTQSPDDSTTSSSDHALEVYRHQRLGHEKLAWKPTAAQAKSLTPPIMRAPSEAEDNAKTATLSKLGHGAMAGLPYGSLPGGPVYGDEIRPALPITTADPVVYPWQRPDSKAKSSSKSPSMSAEKSSAKLCCKALAPPSTASAWQRSRTGTFSPPLTTESLSLPNRMPSSPSRRGVRLRFLDHSRLIPQPL